jgi:5'-3' exonuclease
MIENQCDIFYIDYNHLMRNVLKNCDFNDMTHEVLVYEVVISDIIAYTRIVIDAVKPIHVVYIAIDGPSSKSIVVEQFEKRPFNSAQFTSGTAFMDNFHKRIRSAIDLGLFKEIPQIIFSDSNEEGTGRNKIINHICLNSKSKNVIVYGENVERVDPCNHDSFQFTLCKESVDHFFSFRKATTCTIPSCQG